MNPIEQAIEALWVMTEHNAMHHGSTHNTVIQGREALATLKALQQAAQDDELPPLPDRSERVTVTTIEASSPGSRRVTRYPGLTGPTTEVKSLRPWTDDDVRAYARAAIAAHQARQAVPSGTHVAVIGFRFDAVRQHHVPQLLIEFDPVPVGSPNDAKGWVDRDAVADMLAAAAPTPEATQPVYGAGELAHASERFEQAQTIFEATQPTQAEAPSWSIDVTLNADETRLLVETAGGTEEDEPDPLRLLIGDGHEGFGLYVCAAEYPDEGSIFLRSVTLPPATHPAPKQSDLPAYYVSGPYTVGQHAGMHAVCETATGRVVHRFKMGEQEQPTQAEAPSEREAFERHVTEGGKFPGCAHRDADGNYTNPLTHPARRSWLAALRYAALATHPAPEQVERDREVTSKLLAAAEQARKWIRQEMVGKGVPEERLDDPPQGSHLANLNAAIRAAREAKKGGDTND